MAFYFGWNNQINKYNEFVNRFLIIGPYCSGKSKFLNNMIWYKLKEEELLLLTKLEECTKIGAIIKYTEKEEDIQMCKANLKVNSQGYNYFEIDEKEVYRGSKKFHSKIDELNSDENSSKNLLSIIDGFIHINSKMTFDSGDNDILKLIFDIVRNRNFNFKTCLFIFSKIDIEEKNNQIIKEEELKEMFLDDSLNYGQNF